MQTLVGDFTENDLKKGIDKIEVEGGIKRMKKYGISFKGREIKEVIQFSNDKNAKEWLNTEEDDFELRYIAINVSFDEEYDEKIDIPLLRKKNIHQDEKGEYVLHKHRKYYLKDYL